MRNLLPFVLASLCSLPCPAATATGYQHGMVIRMHMGDCVLAHHGFMTSFGPPQAPVEEACPEYTLVSEKVVFIIVGKSPKEFVPLAEVVDFRFQKNDLMVRVDDERKESKFVIKEMTLRSQWELMQRHIEDALRNSERESDNDSPAASHK
jgi:hypothetical protein